MKPVGLLITVLSTFFYSLTYPLQKKVSLSLPPFTLMAVSLFSAATIAFIFSLIFEKSYHLNISNHKNELLLLLAVGLINFLAFWCLLIGYQYMPLWQQRMITMLSPIFTAVLAYFVLGESISYKLFTGLIIMTAGLYIAIK